MPVNCGLLCWIFPSTSEVDLSSCKSVSKPLVTDSANDCKCGLTLSGQKLEWIVGGTEAEKNAYPWQVGFVKKGDTQIWCGGSLISDSWVLTAAHCTCCTTQQEADKLQVKILD